MQTHKAYLKYFYWAIEGRKVHWVVSVHIKHLLKCLCCVLLFVVGENSSTCEPVSTQDEPRSQKLNNLTFLIYKEEEKTTSVRGLMFCNEDYIPWKYLH